MLTVFFIIFADHYSSFGHYCSPLCFVKLIGIDFLISHERHLEEWVVGVVISAP